MITLNNFKKMYPTMDAFLTVTDNAVFLQKQLQHLESKIYEVEYPEFAYSRVFPIKTTTPEGASSVERIIEDVTGKAKLITGASNDLPRAGLYRSADFTALKMYGISYEITYDEVLASRFTGESLDPRKIRACSRAIEQTLNDIAFNGDAEAGLLGLFTDPNINRANVSGAVWSLKTPDQIVADINEAFSYVRTTSLTVEKASRLVLPSASYTYLSDTRMSTTNDTTILKYIVQNVPSLGNNMANVIEAIEMENAGTGGKQIFLCYTPNEDKLNFDLPIPKRFLPSKRDILSTVTACITKTGGLIVNKPKSMCLREGI